MKTKHEPAPSEYRKLSDEELVYRYAHRHDNMGISCLFERYGHLVWGVSMKYLNDEQKAQETTEQIFTQLLDDLKEQSVEKFKPWLFSYTKNFCTKQQSNTAKSVETMFDDEASYNFNLVLSEETVKAAMNRLDKQQSEYIDMFYLQKLNYAQIAKQTGDPVIQIKKQLQTGKWNLRNQIQAITSVRK